MRRRAIQAGPLTLCIYKLLRDAFASSIGMGIRRCVVYRTSLTCASTRQNGGKCYPVGTPKYISVSAPKLANSLLPVRMDEILFDRGLAEDRRTI